ncbi:MAG: hypothetical protein HYX79_00310 [Chloroflexi bacterium]|nr:hypothetical protein [Chloroflexota bacterium]
MPANEAVMESVRRLDRWVENNGWAGYDPYDIKGHPIVLRALNSKSRNFPLRATRYALFTAVEKFPMTSRRVLGVGKQVNAKAMGLFASAYLELHQKLEDEGYLRKASECLDWLEQNKSQGYAGACWGYPFDWQSLVFIPKGTPSAVVSSVCGDAFWRFYKHTGKRKYIDTCASICDFMLGSLNIDQLDANRLCFSYTPLDRFHVHNANLFAAEFLIWVGEELGNSNYYKHGVKALNYTLDAQNKDGSFYYWALSDRDVYHIHDSSLKNIDHYHTGFVLRCLYGIYNNTGDKKVLEALSRGYRFYRDNLFEDGRIPKFRPELKFPINIHSCAEAILCMSTLSSLFPDALEYAQNTFEWTRDNMQSRDGYFYYMRNSANAVKIPYLRWGQAWMMRAMAELANV